MQCMASYDALKFGQKISPSSQARTTPLSLARTSWPYPPSQERGEGGEPWRPCAASVSGPGCPAATKMLFCLLRCVVSECEDSKEGLIENRATEDFGEVPATFVFFVGSAWILPLGYQSGVFPEGPLEREALQEGGGQRREPLLVLQGLCKGL